MSRVMRHIVPGTLCILCKRVPANTLTRLVARDNTMSKDAMLMCAATCWDCAELLAAKLNVMVNAWRQGTTL